MLLEAARGYLRLPLLDTKTIMRERAVARQTSFIGCKNCWAFGLVGSEGYSTTVVSATTGK